MKMVKKNMINVILLLDYDINRDSFVQLYSYAMKVIKYNMNIRATLK